MKTPLEPGEHLIESFPGSKVEAKSGREWLFKRALTIGTWSLTDKRLIFEGKKPNPLFTFVMQDLQPEIFSLKDVISLEIVPWMKIEEALKAMFSNGNIILIRLQWQTREKLESFKGKIENAKSKLTPSQPPI